MILKQIVTWMCEACLNGDGEECHTPGCALHLHNSPGHPIMPELYTVIGQMEEIDPSPNESDQQ